jgi:hypothetical protein
MEEMEVSGGKSSEVQMDLNNWERTVDIDVKLRRIKSRGM